MPFKTFALVLLTAFSLVLSQPARAQTAQPLKIATIPLPPWGYKDSNGIATGICFEWANEIARRLSRRANNRILPMSRVFKELEHGVADLSILLRTPASEKITIPVATVGIHFETVVWSRKGQPVESFKDLAGMRISMTRGLKVGGHFNEQKDLKIFPSNDYAHSIDMFKVGRVDAVVGTYQSLLYNAHKANLLPSEHFSTPFKLASLEGWVQVSKKFAEREGLEDLRHAIQSMHDDGSFSRIYNQFMYGYQSPL